MWHLGREYLLSAGAKNPPKVGMASESLRIGSGGFWNAPQGSERFRLGGIQLPQLPMPLEPFGTEGGLVSSAHLKTNLPLLGNSL